MSYVLPHRHCKSGGGLLLYGGDVRFQNPDVVLGCLVERPAYLDLIILGIYSRIEPPSGMIAALELGGELFYHSPELNNKVEENEVWVP